MVITHNFSGSRDAAPAAREICHAALARKAAAAGIVLLKNNGILPLAATAPIALFGNGAGHTVKGGIGSGDVNNRENISIYEGLKAAEVPLTSESWIEDYEKRYMTARFQWRDKILEDAKKVENPFDAYADNPFVLPQGRDIEPEDWRGAAAAVYVISRISGEGKDRTAQEGDYRLSEQEREDLRRLDAAELPVILLINAGGPVELTDLMEQMHHLAAILQISQLGQQGGAAVADVLLGKAVPEGKLTATWARRYADYPSADTFGACNGDLEKEIYTEGIYVGYRYHFFNSLNVSMAYFDRVTMNPNACWSNIDNRGWNNTDLAEFGALGLQLLMSGNASIGTDISMLDIIMPTSAMTRRDFTMQSIVRNMGNTPIDGYNLYYSIDGGEEVAVPLSDRTIAANATDTVSTVINIDEPDIATHDITVRVETEGDSNADNNSLTESILIYTTPVARKALLEEFTGMECAYCAEASDHIDTYLKQSNVDTSTVIVAHHVYRGYKYDYYSNENSIAYSSYFGMNGAPQMMINRSSFDGQTLMYDVLGYNPGMMVGIVLNRDCFTALSIETEYDEATRELNITVPVNNYTPLTGSNPTLNVWLTEDGQINWQNSGSGVIQNYEHNHVMRVYVTPAEGDPIETGVGVFEKTYTVTIPEELEGYNADSGESLEGSTRLNADNMHVVAFISNFDTNNPFNCGVINANICKVGGSVNAIEDVVAGQGDAACNVYSYGDNIYVDGTNVGIDVYTLSGTLVKSINTTVDCVNASDLQSGLYIIKVKTSADGESIVKKVLLK